MAESKVPKRVMLKVVYPSQLGYTEPSTPNSPPEKVCRIKMRGVSLLLTVDFTQEDAA